VTSQIINVLTNQRLPITIARPPPVDGSEAVTVRLGNGQILRKLKWQED
jgi:hypothetical protein